MRTLIVPLVFFMIYCAVSDQAGGYVRAAENSAHPRIISLYAAHTEVLLRLGAKDNIIGVSRQESYSGPETEGWRPQEFSARDDVEKFLAAKPDIVLARLQHVASGHLKDALERAGIRVMPVQVTRADKLYDYWRELAALVGRESEAEAMIAGFEARVEEMRTAAESLPRRPGVFLEAIHREVKTFTPDSIPYWLVDAAGGRNAAADAQAASPGVIIADYGPERLLARADDIDVFVSQSGAMNRVAPDELEKRNIYQPLRAFKKGRVHRISEAELARPTPSLLDGLELLSGWIRDAAGE